MKYWVFDLDGTLVDSHSAYFSSLSYVLEKHGAQLTDADKEEVLRISSKDRPAFWIKKVGAQSVESATTMLNARVAEDHARLQPFAGVHDVLSALKSQGAKIAVWTARELESAVKVLEKTGLQKYFSFCVSGTCVSNCKPNPEGLLKIARQFECDPSEVILVGDHDNDMLAARACGAKSIRALWNNPEAALKCTISDLQFDKVGSFKAWMLEQRKIS